MSEITAYTRFDRFQLRLARRSLGIRALILAAMFTVVSGLVYAGFLVTAMPQDRIALALIFLTIIVIGGLMFAVVSALLYKHQAAVIGRQLGIPDLTAAEMVELHIWYRRGILPTRRRLLPVREKYLDYLQPFIDGKQLYASKAFSNVLIVLFSFNFVLAVVNAITISEGRTGHIFSAVLYLFVALLNLSYRLKGGSPFARLFNKRARSTMAARRSELSS